jgi:hypothetical protein
MWERVKQARKGWNGMDNGQKRDRDVGGMKGKRRKTKEKKKHEISTILPNRTETLNYSYVIST